MNCMPFKWPSYQWYYFPALYTHACGGFPEFSPALHNLHAEETVLAAKQYGKWFPVLYLLSLYGVQGGHLKQRLLTSADSTNGISCRFADFYHRKKNCQDLGVRGIKGIKDRILEYMLRREGSPSDRHVMAWRWVNVILGLRICGRLEFSLQVKGIGFARQIFNISRPEGPMGWYLEVLPAEWRNKHMDAQCIYNHSLVLRLKSPTVCSCVLRSYWTHPSDSWPSGCVTPEQGTLPSGWHREPPDAISKESVVF